MQFKLSIAVALACALGAFAAFTEQGTPTSQVAPGEMVALDNFGATCQNPVLGGPALGGTLLRATCRRINGTSIATTVDLKECVINSFGTLRCQSYGGYGGSCSNCALSGTTMCCLCGNGRGSTQATCLDLNQCITNSNSQLTC